VIVHDEKNNKTKMQIFSSTILSSFLFYKRREENFSLSLSLSDFISIIALNTIILFRDALVVVVVVIKNLIKTIL
jgi:hypothetical protein